MEGEGEVLEMKELGYVLLPFSVPLLLKTAFFSLPFYLRKSMAEQSKFNRKANLELALIRLSRMGSVLFCLPNG